MRRAIACAAVVVACGHKDADPTPPQQPPHDAAVVVPPVDWQACETALDHAATVPEATRFRVVIDGCHVCGDWTPILAWATPHETGGPTRADIEAAMNRCTAYCSGEAKDRFLGTLDNARGLGTVTPWRWLGKVCKDKVSALPDTRFASAWLFALDRIARAAAAHGEGARLAKLSLPLPPVSVSGAGVQPPKVSQVAVDMPVHQLTITVGEVRGGPLPRATLGATGVAVDLGSPPYPGDLVEPGKLAPGAYAVIAPHAMPAARVVEVLAATPDGVTARLASLAPDADTDWPLVGVIAIDLAKPPRQARATAPPIHIGDPLPPNAGELVIAVRRADTVDKLADYLFQLTTTGRTSVALSAEDRP